MNWISSSDPLHTSRSIHGFLITAHPESLDDPIIAKDTASPWHIQAAGHACRICRHEWGAGWGWVYSLSIAAVTNHCKLSALRTIEMYSLTVLEARSLKALRACMLSCFSRVQLLETLWTVAVRLLCPWGFSRQEYWNGFPFPPPGVLHHPGIEPVSLVSPVINVSQGCFPSGDSRGISNPCLVQPLAFLGLWLHHSLLGDPPTQGLLHYRQILYQLSHQRSPTLKATVIQMVFSVCVKSLPLPT